MSESVRGCKFLVEVLGVLQRLHEPGRGSVSLREVACVWFRLPKFCGG